MTAREKLIEHLGRLIEQYVDGPPAQRDDPTYDLWERRCLEALRQVDQNGPFMHAQSNEVVAARGMIRGKRWQDFHVDKLNHLRTVKESLELFGSDEDKNELAEIKHRFEVGVNFGVASGKYLHERSNPVKR